MKHLIILFLLCTAFVHAQSDSLSKEHPRYKRWASHNSIKCDPLQIVGGELPISYERFVKGRLSLEATIGPTLTDFMENRYWIETVRNHNPNSTEKNLGITYGIAARFYLQKNRLPMTGFYVSAGIRYRRFNDIGKAHTQELIPQAQFGFQQAFAGPLLLDYYCGLGADMVYLDNGDEWWWDQYYYWPYPVEKTKYTQLLPVLGVRLSFHKHPGVVKKVKLDVPKPDHRFAVKIDPVQSLLGEFPVIFEMRVKNWLSLELTGGITRTQFAKERFYLKVPYFPSAVSSYDKTYFPGTGYVMSMAARFYPFEKSLHGFYFSPRIQRRVYVNQNRFQNLKGKSSSEELSGIVTLGYQFALGKRFLLDVYAGGNVMWIRGFFKYVGETSPSGPQGPFDHWTPVSTEQFELLPTAGVRFGFGF